VIIFNTIILKNIDLDNIKKSAEYMKVAIHSNRINSIEEIDDGICKVNGILVQHNFEDIMKKMNTKYDFSKGNK